jgi:hypothetical protein
MGSIVSVMFLELTLMLLACDCDRDTWQLIIKSAIAAAVFFIVGKEFVFNAVVKVSVEIYIDFLAIFFQILKNRVNTILSDKNSCICPNSFIFVAPLVDLPSQLNFSKTYASKPGIYVCAQ